MADNHKGNISMLTEDKNHFVENQENIPEQNSTPKQADNMKTLHRAFGVLYAPMSEEKEASHKSSTLNESAIRPKSSSLTLTSSRSPKPSKRRSLATLQVSASGKGIVVGSFRADSLPGKKKTARQGKESSQSLQLSTTPEYQYEFLSSVSSSSPQKVDSYDIPQQTSCIHTLVKKSQDNVSNKLTLDSSGYSEQSLADEALKLMYSEPAPETYWEEIAEERRIALEETLEENERLYGEVDALKGRCDELEVALSEAEYFKLLYTALSEYQQLNKTGHPVSVNVSEDDQDKYSATQTARS